MSARILLIVVLAFFSVSTLAAQETIPDGARIGITGRVVVDSFEYAPDLDTVYENCEMVVLGRVLGSRPYLSPDQTEIWTEYRIEIYRVVSAKNEKEAPAPGSEVLVDQLGGKMLIAGKLFNYHVEEMPKLHPQEKVFLFLQLSPPFHKGAKYWIANGPQGVYKVRNGLIEPGTRSNRGHPLTKRCSGMLEAEFEREVLRLATPTP